MDDFLVYLENHFKEVENYYKNENIGGRYPSYEMVIKVGDYEELNIMLETDDVDGRETRKTAGFLEVLIENGIPFSMVCIDGGVWQKSDWDKYNAYKEYRDKIKTAGGDGV